VTNGTNEESRIFFIVETPLGFRVRTTTSYWNIITTIKHPIMKSREKSVKLTLSDPDEIRQSKSDDSVYLFYLSDSNNRWICAVTKKLNGEGFLITTYRTSAIKEGIVVWQK